MSEKKARIAGITLAAVGVCLILLGIYKDEITVIFTKAVNICLECIGIG